MKKRRFAGLSRENRRISDSTRLVYRPSASGRHAEPSPPRRGLIGRLRPAIAICIGIQAPEVCAASGLGASAAWSATSAPRLAKPVAARNANSAGAAKRCNVWLTMGTRAILYSDHTGNHEHRAAEFPVSLPGPRQMSLPAFPVLPASAACHRKNRTRFSQRTCYSDSAFTGAPA